MNLLSRIKLSAHLIFASASQAKRLFYFRPVTALQQCNFYSTKSAYGIQKTVKLTQPRTQKSTSFSQRIKKQTEQLTTVWPRPGEIPYQARVSNFVNLIGYVKIPVRFESASNGKHFATTVISVGINSNTTSLSIPIVFDGDLAHVVACHVKENDCVFVSGQLSLNPYPNIPLLSESLGKFHIVAENLNFVEGFQKTVVDKETEASFSRVEIDKPDKLHNDAYFSQKLREVFENVKANEPAATSESEIDEIIPEKVNERSVGRATRKKNGDQMLDLWRDLVKNPLQWWDYRNHKANGLVKEKFPDFKQKLTGESLWITSAPEWVLPGLGKLEFDVKDFKPKQMQGSEGRSETRKNDKLENSWKNLVENPDKWWDNRMKKKNPKAPDFRHKETGEALWLNNLPEWALSKIPPMKDGVKKMPAY
ncbi:hypothetical protein CDL12_08845 [Handroanthus impetiginosus]|uniref:Uncharacterized protein n=1 Tax=Handroanthus impetiginosus TaxID=429701 RepID=A0A2G9HM14_9LAMI|nr:hypothetical protein CDL12_08845 [Handroanthus impetiginosus]